MKTFKTPIYKNLEFAFTTSTYSTTGNTYVGIHSKENDYIEPYCNLTVKCCLFLCGERCKIKPILFPKILFLYSRKRSFLHFVSNAVEIRFAHSLVASTPAT